MPVDSHIQLPKCILKNFKESSGRVFYLDIANMCIGLCGIKKLGAQYGYFSEDAELFLSKHIESPLASMCNKVKAFIEDDKHELTLSIEHERLLKKYIITSIGKLNYLQKSQGISNCL